jgi:hypothetical protein
VAMESLSSSASKPYLLPSIDSLYYEIIRRLLRYEWKDTLLVEQESLLDTRLTVCRSIIELRGLSWGYAAW